MKGREAFSSGTEFEIWECSWCGKCQNDAAFRSRGFQGTDGCKLIARAMFEGEEDIAEWTEDAEIAAKGQWPRVKCSAFVACVEEAK